MPIHHGWGHPQSQEVFPGCSQLEEFMFLKGNMDLLEKIGQEDMKEEEDYLYILV